MRRTGAALTIVLGAAAIAIGCGEDEASEAAAEGASSAKATASAEATGSATKKVTKLKLQDSEYGRVLFDGKGGALYLFTADGKGKSKCYGECAVEWPPFYARGKIRGGAGVKPGLIGKTTRSDGRKQVTYAGKPLYYWYRDPPNQVLCHDVFEFGGDWLAVTA